MKIFMIMLWAMAITITLMSVSEEKQPLSVRNNNAGNIKYSVRNDWIGQTGENKGFAVFSDRSYGMRATKIVILKNIKATDSVEGFVMRYAAEPNETIHSENLRNYARSIESALGRDFIKESDLEIVTKLVIKFEGGQKAVDYFYE